MLNFNQKKENCTGCSACVSACPVKCISLQQDEEGFLYPQITEDSCIHCDRCEKVCPMVNEKHYRVQEHTAFAAVSRSYPIWHRSASGGAFSEICRAWADKDTLIVGAAWKQNGLEVHHIGIVGVDNISPLCKSKYIASEIGHIFRDIKQYLISGKRAIFCGTPCQVAGLRQFLGKEYDNLLLIDLICHGVGSPKVFAQCMTEIGKQMGQDVVAYEFRTKRKVHEIDYMSRLTLSDGTEKFLVKDPYVQLFLSQDCLRPSCGRYCKYRTPNREGDITIADFKGLTEIFPQMIGTKRNFSTIVMNTPKGKMLSHVLNKNMKMLPCTVENVVRYNPLFDHQTWFSKNRDAFFADFFQNPAMAVKKWTKPAVEQHDTLKRHVFDLLPVALRRIILKKKNKI